MEECFKFAAAETLDDEVDVIVGSESGSKSAAAGPQIAISAPFEEEVEQRDGETDGSGEKESPGSTSSSAESSARTGSSSSFSSTVPDAEDKKGEPQPATRLRISGWSSEPSYFGMGQE